MPPIIETLVKSLSSIATLGRKVNADCRKDIQDTVGDLCDELRRALSLAESYLSGARFIKDDNELVDYLRNADSRLMGTFNEHNICGAIYSLGDRFGQLFDPIKLSVDITTFREIPDLIGAIQYGERSVLEDLDTMTRDLSDCAADLFDALPDAEKTADVRAIIQNKLNIYRSELRAKSDHIARLYRDVIDKM